MRLADDRVQVGVNAAAGEPFDLGVASPVDHAPAALADALQQLVASEPPGPGRFGRFARIAGGRLPGLVMLDRAVQPVAAEEELLAGTDGPLGDVDVDGGGCASAFVSTWRIGCVAFCSSVNVASAAAIDANQSSSVNWASVPAPCA